MGHTCGVFSFEIQGPLELEPNDVTFATLCTYIGCMKKKETPAVNAMPERSHTRTRKQCSVCRKGEFLLR